MIAIKSLVILLAGLAAISIHGGAQATVRVQPANVQGPRTLQEQTASAVIRDYLQSWRSFSAAFEQNRAGLLDSDFVGTAKDQLAATIMQQTTLGMRTRYQDRSHDIQIVFYSPEGQSVELIDKVEYDVQILDRDKVTATQRVTGRYIVVLTPAEVRWRVRVFQEESE
jgi:hypothetical protein